MEIKPNPNKENIPAEANPDPITGEPGSHPLGTGLGSAGGAATGAAIGAIGGPVGMAVGGVIGAVAGGLAGHAVAEGMDPTEDTYWSENFRKEPYFDENYDYPDYKPAYNAGYSTFGKQPEGNFEDDEQRLSEEWEKNRGESRLDWERARPAASAGFSRARDRARQTRDPLTEKNF